MFFTDKIILKYYQEVIFINLYLSDLDGTLLNNQSCLSDFTKENLLNLINKGLIFSVATARTAATVTDIFKDIPITSGILMNGAAIFDFKREEYIKTHLIPSDTAFSILKILSCFSVSPFVYTIKEKYLNVYHKNLKKDYETQFYNQRASRRLKKFFEISSYKDIPTLENILYFCMLTDKDTAINISTEIKKIKNTSVISYKDIHNDFYYVEIMSPYASKASGALWLKDYLKADMLTAFGDNLNDISLLKIADKKICVSNAVSKVKEICDEITENNNNDGVIKYIIKDFK